MKNLQILNKINFFNELNLSDQEAVAALNLRLFRFPARSMILRKGDSHGDLYFVIRGTVTVVGPGSIPLAILKAGEVFGEISFLSAKHSRTADVISNNEVIVMRLDQEAFQSLGEALKGKLKDKLIPILIDRLMDDEMEKVLSLTDSWGTNRS